MLIGITGSSGSGKSYVSNFLKNKLNAEIINFDEISHQVVDSKEYELFVKENISTEVFENNKINRKKLGAIVWTNPDKLSLINKFAEEKMIKIIDKKLQKLSKKHVILDYALLPLMKYFKICDFLILVVANQNTRFQRAQKRENVTLEYFQARENTLPRFEDFEYDFVFENEKQNNPETILEKIKEKLC